MEGTAADRRTATSSRKAMTNWLLKIIVIPEYRPTVARDNNSSTNPEKIILK